MRSPAPSPSSTGSSVFPLADHGIDSLEALREATLRCRECPIGEFATQSVIGEGPLGARLMLVGEQPGDQEDRQGRPFVGPAGQLLDHALAEAGLPREQLFVSNAVKHFKFEPRGKRRIHKSPLHPSALLRVLPADREAAIGLFVQDLRKARTLVAPASHRH
jgi:uracil-DNA glycosylase family protein